MVLSRPEPYDFLQASAGDGAERRRPAAERQAVLLRNAYAENQIPPETIERMVALETSLENRFNTFRAELDGKRVGENEIRADPREVGRPRPAATGLGGLEADRRRGRRRSCVELARVRNAAARDLGWSSFYSMSLELDELDEAEVFGVLDSVVAGSQAPWEDVQALPRRTAGDERSASGSTSCGRGTTATRSSRRRRREGVDLDQLVRGALDRGSR